MTQPLRAIGGEKDPFRTVPEAAVLLGLSESTVWLLIRQRKITSIGIPSPWGKAQRKMRKIRQSEIDRFLKRHTETATG